MIKQAPTKIILCSALFVVGIICCIALDQVIPLQGQSTSQAYGSPEDVSLQPSDAPPTTDTLSGLLQDQDLDLEDLAQSSFNISLSTDLPETFEKECFEKTDFASIYSSGSIFSLTFNGDKDAARRHCESLLQEKGWRALEDNNELIGSFSRPEGTYRWLVLQYFTINDKTVIVVNAIDKDQLTN